MVDETHDPRATSWVETAQESGCAFPLQNLPYCVFRAASGGTRAGVGIGEAILPLDFDTLLPLMAEPKQARAERRLRLHRLLRSDADAATRDRTRAALVPITSVELLLPAAIGDYTDFFGSIHHAVNAASMMRPGEGLFANYRHLPLAYHGRASSVVVSGTAVPRPHGQRRSREAGSTFSPTRRLDYEAEIGYLVAGGNALGTRIPIEEAWDHIFGATLLNDWSARDFQAWESDPLGPFLGKSFATTLSPWIVTAETLEPFRAAPAPRGDDAPALLDYLSSEADRANGAVAIQVDVLLLTATMRAAGDSPVRISRSTSATQYWTPAQLVTHQTSNGCNLRPGDLLGSGTLSGPSKESWACLLELTRGGRDPITLPNGETRTFLEDGDEVILRGRCEKAGAVAIGFGHCSGRVAAIQTSRLASSGR